MGCSCWVGWVNRGVGQQGDWVFVAGAGNTGTADVDDGVGMVDEGGIRLEKGWCAGGMVRTGCNP